MAVTQNRSACRVLIADGNPSLLALFSSLLEREGYTVETACSGKEALTIAANFRPKVAFVCTELSTMSGYELARAFRDTGHHNLVIAAMTTQTEADSTPAWKLAEFAHVLRKPVDVEHMLGVLAAVATKPVDAPFFTAGAER